MHCSETALFKRSVFGSLILVFLFFPEMCYPGQWRVAPAKVFFDRAVKSSVITVLNEGEEKIHLQVKAVEWTQDREGKDVFLETNDLLFFPRILTIDKGDQKIIRAGIKTPATTTEKTYRIFIEEIPQPKQDAADSARLIVAVRFGVPVFVKPAKDEPRGEVASMELAKGVFNAVVKNGGNVHFRITGITVRGGNDKGEETFSEKLNGWYLLAGAARLYSIAVPPEKCAVTQLLDITVSTDTKITLNRRLNVEKAQCRP